MKKLKFWIIIAALCVIAVGLPVPMNLIPYVVKPADRVYTGLQGFVDDYIGYVSYVKEGMYGSNYFKIRSIPPPQPAKTAQWIYILIGKTGRYFSSDAPIIYHVSRAILGVTFFLLMSVLYLKLFASQKLALVAAYLSIISLSAGWYIREGGRWVYHTFAAFGFTDNIAGRFNSRPHYLLGAILFVITIYLLMSVRKRFKPLILFITALLLGTVHPAFTLILGTVCGVMILITLAEKRSLSAMVQTPYLAVILGAIVGLALSYWSTHLYPYTWILAFENYVYFQRLSWQTVLSDIIAYGPALWLALPGFAIMFIRNKLKNEADRLMLVWLMVQLTFFFVLYRYLGTERMRYVQSLYFIPMVYGTILFLREISLKFHKIVFGLGLILLSLVLIPTVISDTIVTTYYHNNFRSFDLFQFPTIYQKQAYDFLDKNTPRESMVVAGYEATNHILIWSHNYVVGNKQGWPEPEGSRMEQDRNAFYAGMYPVEDAKKYLAERNIKYVYDGWQEPDGFLKYGQLLKIVYQNQDAAVYEVQY